MDNGKFVLYHTKQKKSSAIYVYYMIAWYFRKNKKPVRKTLKNLGTLNEIEIEHYKNSIACLNNEPNMFPCNINKLVVNKSNEYLSCAVGKYFWDYWNLSAVFQDDSDKKDVSTDVIAFILTVIRLVQPCSKNFTTKLYNETCLPQLTGVSSAIYNKARIFRELESIESHREQLGKHIFNFAKKKKLTNGNLFFYDLSSGNLSGLKCVMAKWGHCKDGYNTHIVLLLVITPEGYPVYWELLEGNTADVATIEALISKIERIYGKVDSVLCFDRGMVSDENLLLLEKKNIQFITALDGNQVDHFKDHIDFSLIDEVKQLDIKNEIKKIKTKLILNHFQYVKKNLFYKEIKLTKAQKKTIEKTTKKLNLINRRYFLAFNPELAYLTDKHRRERINAFSEWIEVYNKELAQALINRKKEVIEKTLKKEAYKRKISNIDLKYFFTKYSVSNKNKKNKMKTSTTYKIKLLKVTAESYQRVRQYDGLWMLITNIASTDENKFFSESQFENFFDVYRLKNNIEESFKILSNFVELEPFYVYKTEHIKAHFTICILSYLISITILNKIRISSEIKNMDLHNIFHILKKCKQDIIQLDEKVKVSKVTQVTKKQKKILKALDCSYLISNEYLTSLKIVSANKKRA